MRQSSRLPDQGSRSVLLRNIKFVISKLSLSSRWITFTVVCLTSLYSGLIYIFGILSSVLISKGVSPTQSDLVYSVGGFGHYCGIIPGFIHDNLGPHATCVYGLVLIVLGYSALTRNLMEIVCSPNIPIAIGDSWRFGVTPIVAKMSSLLSSSKLCPKTKTPHDTQTIMHLAWALLVSTQGGTALHYAVLPSLLTQFPPDSRCVISGFVTAAYGISAAFLSLIFTVFTAKGSADEPPQYLLTPFIAFLGIVMTIFGALSYLVIPPQDTSAPSLKSFLGQVRRFVHGSGTERYDSKKSLSPPPASSPGLDSTGVDVRKRSKLVELTTLTDSLKQVGHIDNKSLATGVVSAVSPENLRDEIETVGMTEVSRASVFKTPRASRVTSVQDGLQLESDEDVQNIESERRNSLRHMLCSADYVSYFFFLSLTQSTCASIIGNVVLYKNAFAPVGVSSLPLSALVSLFSVANCLSRIFSGLISASVLSKRGHSLPWTFVVTSTMLCTVLTLMLIAPTAAYTGASLVFILVILAAVVGGNFAVGPAWLICRFPESNFASLHSVTMAGVATATAGCSYLIGLNYELTGGSETDSKCHGTGCFYFVTCVQLAGALFCVRLAVKLARNDCTHFLRTVNETGH